MTAGFVMVIMLIKIVKEFVLVMLLKIVQENVMVML